MNTTGIQTNAAAHAAGLRRLQWRVRHAADSALSGAYRSTFRGRGREFDQVVKYEYGDDVRDIDWNVTARRGEPFRKQFVEEREVSVVIVFEDSPSLRFGSTGRTKRDALLEMAALICLLSAQNQDRCAVVHVTPRHCNLPRPAVRRQAILHQAATLMGSPAPPMQAGLFTPIPWHRINHAYPRHSLLLWLGDHPARPRPQGWPALTRRFQTIGCRIDDPWDLALPDCTSLHVYDPVFACTTTLYPRSSAQRQAHARWRKEREESFRAHFPDPTSRLCFLTTEDPLTALTAFFRRRENLARH